MRLGIFQFRGSGNIERNQEAILRGITLAREREVRLLVFQECAVCGYPRVEAPADISLFDYNAISQCVLRVQEKAREANLYIALGSIRRESDRWYNTTMLFNPQGNFMGHYDKRALWGTDKDIFERGGAAGIFDIDGIRVGFRICFEVRFPEYFRELYKQQVQLCCISFCDVSEKADERHREIIRAHLLTRAVENVMVVASANSLSQYQTAPTSVIDANGCVVLEAPEDEEHLLVYDYTPPEIDFGIRGRIENNRVFFGE